MRRDFVPYEQSTRATDRRVMAEAIEHRRVAREALANSLSSLYALQEASDRMERVGKHYAAHIVPSASEEDLNPKMLRGWVIGTYEFDQLQLSGTVIRPLVVAFVPDEEGGRLLSCHFDPEDAGLLRQSPTFGSESLPLGEVSELMQVELAKNERHICGTVLGGVQSAVLQDTAVVEQMLMLYTGGQTSGAEVQAQAS